MEQLNNYNNITLTYSITVGKGYNNDQYQCGYYRGKYGSITPDISEDANPEVYGFNSFYYTYNPDTSLPISPFILSFPFFLLFGIKAFKLIITIEGKEYEANYKVEGNHYEGTELINLIEGKTYDITIRIVSDESDEPDEPEQTQYSTSTDMNGSIFIYYTKSVDLDGNIIIYKPKAKSYTFIC